MRILAALLLVSLAAPALLAQEGEDPTARHTRELALRFGKFYEPAPHEVTPSLPATVFPIDAGKVAGWESVERLGLSQAAQKKLLEQGFVATSGFFRGEAAEDVVKAYESLEHREGLSLLVTSDALLHLYHIQFDESLKGIEEREFYLDAVLLVRALGRRALEIASSHDATLAAAGELALGYLAVADRLLSVDEAALKKDIERLSGWQVAEYGSAEATEAFLAKLPSLPAPLAVAESDLARGVEKDLASARAHEGFEESALFDYREDFSQYKPRGHYERSEMLRAYFRGLMWLGRMTFLLKGGEPYGPAAPYLVPATTADRQTRAAALLAALLDEKLPDGRLAREVWERLYSVTAYYVGLADDLTPGEYRTALSAISDSEDGKLAIELARELALPGDALLAYRWELARCAPPAIYSGTGESMVTDRAALAGEPSPQVLDKLLEKTMGFRFLGQRFVPDSYWMGRLVFPTVGAATEGPADRFTGSGGMRIFPRGLDVMALLGSARARAVLAEGGDDAYKGYAEEFVRLS
ncbi:MAG: DUF3160 domain-containing protein, partial [Planctomycetes bacterium]|nr:DUF3160 domain-containing protein [Planctomycetota bacterium]